MANEFVIKHGLIVSGTIVTTGNITISGSTVATQSWVQSQGYLTSFSESDTLNSVTSRGATTSNAITTSTHTISNGYLILSGASSGVNPEIEFTDDSGFGVAGYKLRYGNSDGWTFYDSYWASGGGHRFRTSVASSTIEALTITHTGNVGIGTTNPLQTLHVAGNIQMDSGLLRFPTNVSSLTLSNVGGWWNSLAARGVNLGDWSTNPDYGDIRVGDYDFEVIRTDNTRLLIITNSGNVGIKSTNPTAHLSFGASSYDNNPLAGLQYTQVTGGGRLDLKVQTWGTGSDYGLTTGLTLLTPGFDTNNTRVGIGTTTPDEKLQVVGNIKIQNETGLITDYGPLVGRYNTSQVYVGTGGNYSIVKIGRGDGGALNVLSGGNVGIGTASPGWKLHVAGESYTSGVVRIGGTNPFYFEDYGGGFYMQDGTWIRTWANRGIWVNDGYLGGQAGLTIGYGGTSPNTYGGAIFAGKVGIGTDYPSGKLDVVGDNSVLIVSSKTGDTSLPTKNLAAFNGVYNNGSNGHNLYINSTQELGPWEFNITKTWGGFLTFGVSSDGTARTRALYVNSNGYVGVGVNPTSGDKMEIAGSLRVHTGNNWDGIQIYAGGADGYIRGIGDETGLHIRSEYGNILLADDRGNVGIGLTTPQRKFDVNNGAGIHASISGGISPGQFAGLHFGYSESHIGNDNYKKSALVFERTDNHGQGGNASGRIHFLLNNIGGASASSLSHSIMVIDTDASATQGSARVGIGTTSPSTALQVNGVITATGGNSTNWNTAYSWGNHASAGYLTSVSDVWVNTTGDTMTGSLTFASTADNVRIQKNSSFLNLRDPYNNIHLYNAGDGTYIDASVHYWRSQGASYWMTLNGGNLGIGTNSPNAKLHVSGAAIFDGGAGDAANDSVVYITKSNNNDWGLYVNASGLDYGMYARVSPSAGYAIGINNGTSWTTRFTGDGTVYLNEKNTIASYDTWLRLNQSGNYSSGIYTPGLLRADGGFQVNGSTVWHSGNDGSGSGLDADLLDGQHASYFINTSNIGSQSVNYANSAGSASTASSVAWGNITGKPSGSTGLVQYGDFINYPTFAGKTVTMHPSIIKTLLWGGEGTRYTVTDSYTGTYPQAGSTLIRTIELIDGSNSVYSSGNVYCGFWNNCPPTNITVRVQNTSGTWYGPYQGSNIGVGYFEYWRIPCGGPNFIKKWEITFTPTAGCNVALMTLDIVIDNDEGIDQRPLVGRGGSSMYGNLSFVGSGNTTKLTLQTDGVIVFPNDSAAGLSNASGTAGFRPDDIYGNIYTWNSSGGYYVDANSYYFRSTGATNWMTINGGTVQATSDFRAPIFYDSNDTNYYVDPNGTSNLRRTYLTASGNDWYLNLNGLTLTTISTGETIWRNLSSFRFSDVNDWDYNSWAGLKFINSTKQIVLGVAGNIFTANSPQTGTLLLDRISTVYVNNTSQTVWHSGNLTNLNQLTNGPGYITGYTETDTLATVVGRGNSTGGNRPIVLDNGGGAIVTTASAGGWAMGSYYNGSGGTTLAGFGAYGSNNLLTYAWIGSAYNSAWMTINSSESVLNTSLTINGTWSTNISTTGGWSKLSFTASNAWGDGTTYGVLGASGGNEPGVMTYNQHATWVSSGQGAGVRMGRSGGVSSGAWYQVATMDSDEFMIAKNGSWGNGGIKITSGGELQHGNSGNKYWHAGNDGSGSGLDADLLDGQDSSYFINTSNIASQSVATASEGLRLLREDNRTISPSELSAGYLKFGFTSWTNDFNPPYADFLHLRSYTDGSGGSDNLVMFLKNGIGMRIWQQTFGSSNPYSSYVDVWTTGNFTQSNVNNWNTAYGWGNHASQSYATTSYVTTQINNLINGAPGALDTLSELASALGNDASFATTVTNSIASKLSLSGGTMTGQILFQTSALNNGFRWDVNSDAAGITFKNTGDGDNNSYFNFFTEDNGNEYFKFSHNTWNIGSFDFMDVKNGVVRTNGNIYVNASQSGTRSAGTNELINGNRVWHDGDFSSSNVSNWNTAYGWGNHASAGYALNSSLANYLPLAGGTLSGGLNFGNNDIYGINNVRLNDPGVGEGVTWEGGNGWGIFECPDIFDNTAGNLQFALNATTRLMTLNTAGALWIAGALTEASSLKLKENVETSEGNLEKVVNLRPVTYNKIGSQTTELGLIAEEVAEVYPEFVQYDENGDPVGVHYSRLTAALIGAVKELTNQVQELNKKING